MTVLRSACLPRRALPGRFRGLSPARQQNCRSIARKIFMSTPPHRIGCGNGVGIMSRSAFKSSRKRPSRRGVDPPRARHRGEAAQMCGTPGGNDTVLRGICFHSWSGPAPARSSQRSSAAGTVSKATEWNDDAGLGPQSRWPARECDRGTAGKIPSARRRAHGRVGEITSSAAVKGDTA